VDLSDNRIFILIYLDDFMEKAIQYIEIALNRIIPYHEQEFPDLRLKYDDNGNDTDAHKLA
jgi:hypothetical protein